MYQRYYKQKKFGRFFGFFLVIGSGVYHFIKTNIHVIKHQFSLKNLIKFENFLPDQAKILSDSIQQYLKMTQQATDTYTKTSLELEAKFHIYSKNLDQLNRLDAKSEVNISDDPTNTDTDFRTRNENQVINFRENKLNNFKKKWLEYEKSKENIHYYQKVRKKVDEIINKPRH